MKKIDKIISENIERVINEAKTSKDGTRIAFKCDKVRTELVKRDYDAAKSLLNGIYQESSDEFVKQYVETALAYLEQNNINGVNEEIIELKTYVARNYNEDGGSYSQKSTGKDFFNTVHRAANGAVDRVMNKWFGVNVHHSNKYY